MVSAEDIVPATALLKVCDDLFGAKVEKKTSVLVFLDFT